ncbi:hypothetical protein [Ideonella sp. BN130291]|uniref:hypothetical protein n=1 Tax=Ideonella sp. BN130291 TaxID=3112940 RepID=UPI002E275983|nr:hypothetical protein [Ideonella sp. BN130291]
MPLHARIVSMVLLSAIPLPAAVAQPVAPAATHRSAFDGYNRFAEQPVAPWRTSNELVARIGGWKAYAREAAAAHEGAAAPAGAPSAPAGEPGAASPAAAGHAGHHGGPKP